MEAGLGDALFAEVSRQREAAGFMVKTGTLIDASLVEAAVRRPPDGSTPKGQESRAAHDPGANWTRTARGTKRFFGYKIHELIGRVRTAVERAFSGLKRGPYGFVRMRYRGLAQCSLHLDIVAIAYNLRWAAG